MVCISISGEIKFSELSQSEVEKLLEFIYTGSTSFDTKDDFDQFIDNAKKLQLRRLPDLENGSSGVAPEPRSAAASSVE